MRVCLVYDCLFPYTVGGAERWYRNLAERLAAEGQEVPFLTRRQWARGTRVDIPAVRVVALEPRMPLYTDDGRRRIDQALVFGAVCLAHFAGHGRRYDVVHTASFPYFSLLAAALVRPLRRYGLVVDWHEVWTLTYWRKYLGSAGGRIGWVRPGRGPPPTGASTWAAPAGASAGSCSGCAHICPNEPSASRACTHGACAPRACAGTSPCSRAGTPARSSPARPRTPRVPWPCSPAATSRRSACPPSCPRSHVHAKPSPSCAPRSSATDPSARRSSER